MHGATKGAAAAAVLLLAAGAAAHAGGTDLSASWDSGIRLGSADGSTKIKLGGRLQNDWVFQRGDDELVTAVGPLEDGTEFRRVRLYVSGLVGGTAIFKSQVDFAGGKTSMKDVWIGLADVGPLGKVTIGHQYEPFGLEERTSDLSTTFVERSVLGAFTPERNTGLLIEDAAGAASWAAGVFREADGTGKSVGGGEYDVTGRFSVRPLNEDGGRRLVHLGVAGSLRRPPGDEVEYASSPENHLAPDFASTGMLSADRVVLAGLEAAVVQGPVSVQGEYIRADVSTLNGSDPSCDGFYVLASWFPTGEHRPFSSSSGTFGRVKPRHAYDGNGGAGAWEIAARYSRLDLEEAGGAPVLSDVTAGVSWYLNPNIRWVTDYVRADVDGVGVSHAVLARAQADF